MGGGGEVHVKGKTYPGKLCAILSLSNLYFKFSKRPPQGPLVSAGNPEAT